MYGTIHLRRRQFFHDFWPLPPYRRQFFTTIRRQIWQIFDPSPTEKCQRGGGLKNLQNLPTDSSKTLPTVGVKNCEKFADVLNG